MADKQNRVTAASMLRRARAHRDKVRAHKLEARLATDEHVMAAHTGAAMANHDAAEILTVEAKHVRAEFKTR